MSNYWVKIGLGAACVFGVGMTGISLAKKGIHEIKTAAIGPIAQALSHLPSDLLRFRLDGRRIGQIKQIEVASKGEWDANSIQMKVALDREAEGLSDCLVASESWGEGQKEARFRCVDKAAISDESLVEVGRVEFNPGSIVRPLFVAEHDVRRLDRSDIRGLKASLSAPDDKSVTGDAKFDIADHAGKRQQGTVHLDAADGRALIEIKDDNGNELFRLRADDHGVSISAKDKKGNALLRLLAGDAGVDVKVNAEKNP